MAKRTIKLFDVWLHDPGDATGGEIQNRRPCIVVSPDKLNKVTKGAIIVPMTTAVRENFLYRVDTNFNGQKGQAAINQVRSADADRLITRLGKLNHATSEIISDELVDIFKIQCGFI